MITNNKEFFNKYSIQNSRAIILRLSTVKCQAITSLRLVYSYLTKRKQRTKINTKYSSLEDI